MKLRDLFFVNEAVYAGNIGAMEMLKFFQVATKEQKQKMKELLARKKNKDAWNFLQSVVGIKLHPLH